MPLALWSSSDIASPCYKLSIDNQFAYAEIGKYTIRASWDTPRDIRYIFVGYSSNIMDNLNDRTIEEDTCINWFKSLLRLNALTFLNPALNYNKCIVDGIYRGFMRDGWLSIPNDKLVRSYLSISKGTGNIRMIVFSVKIRSDKDMTNKHSFNKFKRTWG